MRQLGFINSKQHYKSDLQLLRLKIRKTSCKQEAAPSVLRCHCCSVHFDLADFHAGCSSWQNLTAVCVSSRKSSDDNNYFPSYQYVWGGVCQLAPETFKYKAALLMGCRHSPVIDLPGAPRGPVIPICPMFPRGPIRPGDPGSPTWPGRQEAVSGHHTKNSERADWCVDPYRCRWCLPAGGDL